MISTPEYVNVGSVKQLLSPGKSGSNVSVERKMGLYSQAYSENNRKNPGSFSGLTPFFVEI
jgi:hypothetical protein